MSLFDGVGVLDETTHVDHVGRKHSVTATSNKYTQYWDKQTPSWPIPVVRSAASNEPRCMGSRIRAATLMHGRQDGRRKEEKEKERKSAASRFWTGELEWSRIFLEKTISYTTQTPINMPGHEPTAPPCPGKRCKSRLLISHSFVCLSCYDVFLIACMRTLAAGIFPGGCVNWNG